MTYSCPKGHASETADWCSECGAAISSKGSSLPQAAAAASADTCPICSTDRTPGGRFCEVCRYDYVAGKPSEAALDEEEAIEPQPTPPPEPTVQAPPVPTAPPIAAPAASPPSPGQVGRPITGNLWAVVTADKTLPGASDDPAFPATEPTRSYPLDLDENLAGRRGGRVGIHPEIPVNDASVSARHCKICRRKDGSAYLVDVGSTNGTTLNGQPLEQGVEAAIEPGDEIVIGAWTRITIQVR